MTTETIVIDEEGDDVIEIINLEDTVTTKETNNENYESKIELACNEEERNPLLTIFIKKCMEKDTSKIMLSILHLLLRVHKRIEHEYKNSEKFNKLLNRAIESLKNNPTQKYKQIKMVYDSLKIYDTSNKGGNKTDVKIIKEKHPENLQNIAKDTDIIEIDDELTTECDQNAVKLHSENESSLSNECVQENKDTLDSIKEIKLRLIDSRHDIDNILHSESSDNETVNDKNGEVRKLNKGEANATIATKHKIDEKTSLLIPVAWTNEIEIINLEDTVTTKETNNENYESKIELACNEEGMNPLLTIFIKKCMEKDTSKIMLSILHLLLRVHKRIEHNYKSSEKFNKLLNRAIESLKNNPTQKYNQIKMVFDSLKIYDTSNKGGNKTDVKIIKEKHPENLQNIATDSDIIEIDDELTTECDQNAEKLHSENESSLSNIRHRISFEDTECVQGNKDTLDSIKEIKQRLIDSRHDIDNILHSESSDNETVNDKNGEVRKLDKGEANAAIGTKHKVDEKTSLLIPVAWTDVDDEINVNEKIKNIENEILVYKRNIEHYETKEVSKDNRYSPYLISWRLKTKIVKLYEELCKLTGECPVKRREIRLNVAKGLPPGPATRLEQLINNNIGTEGNLHFPDFRDVFLCVKNANESDDLGWNKGKILTEAQALFQRCGQALQQWRQKREWLDVVSRVNKEELDNDPADKDPALMEKLMQNRKLAISKENEVLERYTNMQLSLAPVTMEMAESESDADDTVDIQKEVFSTQSDTESELPVKRIKLERVDHSQIFAESLVIEISDSSDESDIS